MNAKMIKRLVVKRADELQKQMGESFLELMVNTVSLVDDNGEEVETFYGFEYSLSRSRHWDVQQENHIMYDGYTDEHLDNLLEDIEDLDCSLGSIIFEFDGMSDLDEPVRNTLTIDLDDMDD